MKNIVELGACECRWPVYEEADEGMKFCAGSCDFGDSYCAAHRRESLAAPGKKPWQGTLVVSKRTGGLISTARHSAGRILSVPTLAQKFARERKSEETRYDLRSDHTPDLVSIFERGE
jgi:hypothetical protein